MKQLRSLDKFFVRYRGRLLLGFLFVVASNVFAVSAPTVVRDTVNNVLQEVQRISGATAGSGIGKDIFELVFWNGLLILGLAVMRGIFMFMMRQTLIVMSRHIEYDQKNEIYKHYQELHTSFYKTQFTGDLMNRISEDVGRVRQYTGPAIMYAMNIASMFIMCIWCMVRVNPLLTLYVIAPLPLLALSIYLVNRVIYSKSEKIQAQLSGITTTAQETYSGIRVIKSFAQEENMLRIFESQSEDYRKSAVNLGMSEAVYFPAMNLFVGLSFLITILVGGYFTINGQFTAGGIAQFILYINLLMFPISSIGMIANIIQRASVSQKRIDEFLDVKPEIVSPENGVSSVVQGDVSFRDVTFQYPHTGVTALRNFNLDVRRGEKVAIIGKTGSGKSTIAHLLLRMYDAGAGTVSADGIPVGEYDLEALRQGIGYAPQEPYLFSDTVYNNIRFGRYEATEEDVRKAARMADLEKDIDGLENGFETVIGERGVMLSGGQKQRLVLARALLKNSRLLLLDDSLSAVDTRTEQIILGNLKTFLEDKTTIVITHRIFTSWTFDQIIVLDDGRIVEQGDHASLMALDGRYAKLYKHQTEMG